MQFDQSSLYRQVYGFLLRFYPRPYRERFGEGMGQTFNDLCREREVAGKGHFGFMLWVFSDTCIGIISVRIAFIFSFIVMHSKHILRPALGTLAILMIPLVAMQFSREVNWGPEDFIVMGTLLFGMGLAFEFIASRSESAMYKFAIGLATITSLMLVWVTLAVGIIGDDNPANLFYLGIPLIGFVGACAAGFRPQGMAIAAFLTGAVQFVIPVVALILWSPAEVSWAPGVVPVFILNAFFAMLYAAAGFLFHHAVQERK